PLTLLAAAPAEEDEEEVEHGPGRVPHQVQAAPPEHDPVLQASVAPLLLPQTSTNFDGIGLGFLGVNTRAFEVHGVPPDPQGDVGPSHYLQIVNASFAAFAKNGRTLFGPIATRTLFAGFGGACEESGGDFRGIAYCAFDRRKMLAAEPAAQQCILIHDPVSGTTPADLDGSLPPPAGESNTAVGFIGGSLALYRFHADWSDPLNSFVE